MKLKTYIVKSAYSEKPVAVLRVSDDAYEVLDDNSNGELDQIGRGSFRRLMASAQKSSHLRIVESDEPQPQYTRYLLSNGDVAEITTDGETVFLNDQMLNEEEKEDLLGMLNSGALSVTRKDDDNMVIPVMPEIKTHPMQRPQASSPSNDAIMSGIRDRSAAKKRQELQDSPDYYTAAEEAKFDTLDPAFTKNLAYGMKFGKFKGGGRA